jgi:hypothetical protein
MPKKRLSHEDELKSTAVVKLEDIVNRISCVSSRSSKNSKRRKTEEPVII